MCLHSQNWLVCLLLIIVALSDGQNAGFKDVDADGNGEISREEFTGSLRSQRFIIADQDFEKLFFKRDKDGSGAISPAEYIKPKGELLQEVLAKYDADGDYRISKAELTTFLTDSDVPLLGVVADDLFSTYDVDGAGFLTFSESFVPFSLYAKDD